LEARLKGERSFKAHKYPDLRRELMMIGRSLKAYFTAFIGLTSLILVPLFIAAQKNPYRPPGRLIDIGGYKLHLYCTGGGSPTVILSYGAGGTFLDWALVQPDVAKFTRVCSYDRAYEGFSDAGPLPITLHQQVFELHQLLRAANIDSPFVLVGQSLGGMQSQLFLSTYPQEVVGMVLIDSTSVDTPIGVGQQIGPEVTVTDVPPPQTIKSSPPLPPNAEDQKLLDKGYANLSKLYAGPTWPSDNPRSKLPIETQQMERWLLSHPKPISFAKGDEFTIWIPRELHQIKIEREDKKNPFGDLPLLVLGARGTLEDSKRQTELNDMVMLSTNSLLIVDPVGEHYMQTWQPQLVVRAIRQVVEAVKSDGRIDR